jgi:hypothetical protein
MRIRTTAVAVGLAAALCAAVALRAGAEEGGPPPVQKQVKCALTDALLGTWTTESTADWGKGKGKATFSLGVGGTAMLLDYENRNDGAPPEAAFYGHGVYKVSDDGKTITTWWFDTHSPEPVKLSGPLTEKGYDIQGTYPGGTLRLTLEKKGEGWEFKMHQGDRVQMTETYTKAAPK